MSLVIGSFKNSITLLKENSLIIGIFFAMGILALPTSAARVMHSFSLMGMGGMAFFSIILYLVWPYVTGGIYGMIKEVQGGKRAGFETFKTEGRKHYIPLLVSYVLFFILFFVVMFGFGAFAAIVGFLARKGFLGVSQPNPALIVLMMMISIGLSYLMLYFFQFFDVGIVINGYSSLQSFKESFRFVWSRKLSVLGFSILLFLIMLPMMLPGFLLTFTMGPVGSPFFTPLPLGQAVLFVIGTLLISTISGAVMTVYRAVYYIQAGRE